MVVNPEALLPGTHALQGQIKRYSMHYGNHSLCLGIYCSNKYTSTTKLYHLNCCDGNFERNAQDKYNL